ncbi:unnamed protein product [Brassica rapa subsp. trilocularis]
MKEDNKILFADLNSITNHVSHAYIEINLTNMKKVSNTNIMDHNIKHDNIKEIKLKIKCHQMTKKIISHIIIILIKLIKKFREH